MPACDLCGLPTPDPPVTDAGGDGSYCCTGCLAVARQFGTESAPPDEARLRDVARELPEEWSDAPPTGAAEIYLSVDGMHCVSCEAYVRSVADRVGGIFEVQANAACGLARVTYDPARIDRTGLEAAIDGLGYAARPVDEEPETDGRDLLRLSVGGVGGVVTMMLYVAFLYPTYLGLTPGGESLLPGPWRAVVHVQLWLAATVVLLVTGRPILRRAVVGLRTGIPNMDLLIALAATNAYVYSTAVTALGGDEVYFDIVVVIVLVVTLGTRYEERVRDRATGLLSDLAAESVDTARRRTEGGPESVSVEDLRPGDVVVVRVGERVPVDGTVRERSAAIDRSLVTGESRPARVTPGDAVIGGVVVVDGTLVLDVGSDVESTLDRVVDRLWEIQCTRPGIQRLADRLAAVFVPLVLVLAVAGGVWQLYAGASPVAALLTGLAVLVVSCPCALGLATPLAVASGTRAALERGIVVTDPDAIERATSVDVVALDKTGTLTTGDMRVVEADDERALRLAAAVEAHAAHPIAEAITRAPTGPVGSAEDVTHHSGRGVSGRVDGVSVVVGHPDLFHERAWSISLDLQRRIDDAREAGHVPVVVGWAGRARTVIAVGDHPRSEWEDVVTELASDGRTVVILTGDDAQAATTFDAHPSVERVFSEIRPQAKAVVIERLRERGTVAMVGDGSNDALALAMADLGIGLDSGSALAADAADVVIPADDLRAVPEAFAILRRLRRRVRENLAWAFVYNAIAIPLALSGHLNPLVAAIAMTTSSLLVVGNSTRSFSTGTDGIEPERARSEGVSHPFRDGTSGVVAGPRSDG